MPLGIGIIGTGRMAAKMANTLARMDEVHIAAVASRDGQRAAEFAHRFNIPGAYEGCESLMQDDAVRLVYIATPHALHYEQMMLCLQYGKHILCEKAFTCTAGEAADVLAEAERLGLMVTEAMWTRYAPLAGRLVSLCAERPVGEIAGLTANLCYPVYYEKTRLQRPELGGGALLDIGIYALTFADIVFNSFGTANIAIYGNKPKLSDTGMDMQNTVILDYGDGRTATLAYSAISHGDRRGVIMCERGYIVVENINNFESIGVYDGSHKLLTLINQPPQISGYEYEVRAAVRAIANGALECAEMPHSKTVEMMELMDRIRDGGGIVFQTSGR